MTTTPSAETASTGDQAAGETARVTSILAKRLQTSGRRIGLEGTETYLTFGSLLSDRYALVPTAIQQLSPWSLCSVGAALQQAMTDVRDTLATRTSGETVTLVFATPVWRLLIATTNTELPAVWGGELFESGSPMIWRFLTAKLFAQPRLNEDNSFNALRVWHVVAPVVDDEATSQFLSTALALSLTHSTTDSVGSK